MSSERGRGPAVGRGDLLRAFAEVPGAKVEIAQLLGYAVQERRVEPAASSEAPGAVVAPVLADFDVPLWRAETLVSLRDPEEAPPTRSTPPPSDAITLRDVGRLPNVPPPSPPPPIATWARLRRTMESVYRRARPIGDVDVDAIVRGIGRGAPIIRIPREDRQVAVNRVIVILDRCERLLPFWSDQEAVYRRLRREVGDDRLRVAVWQEGPPDAIPRLQEGDAVLLLGDVGHYGGAHVQRAWARLADDFRRQGVCGAALLPVPVSRWDSALTRRWRAVDWANPTRGVARAAPNEEELTLRRDDLLALLSWTVRTELELVRDVRSRLPATDADVGTEADLWNHPEIGRHSGGLLVPESLRRTARDRLLELLADPNCKARFSEIVQLVRRRHAWLPQEIWIEEARALELLGLGDCLSEGEGERVQRFTRGVRVLLERNDVLGESIDVSGWAERGLSGRVPESGWQHPTLGPELAATFELLRREDDTAEMPPGLTVGMLPSSQVEGAARRLVLTDPPVDPLQKKAQQDNKPSRSWLISSAIVEAVRDPDHGSSQLRLSWTVARLARAANLTERERDILDRVLRGRLNAEIAEELGLSKATVKSYMHNIFIKTGTTTREALLREALQLGRSGPTLNGGRGSPLVTVVGRGSRISVKQIGQAGATAYAVPFWRSIPLPNADSIEIETDCDRVTLSLRGTPDWAHAAGRDRFGLWAAFRVGKVEQRMRWIPPGRFWMGSTASELGRWDDEGPQHHVTITRGYWLAETPCTQALWQAVMGQNPSFFLEEGEQRPVESVSWHDVQTFTARLEQVIATDPDGTVFRLPSEAEWEYACRAGTTTATYVGNLVDAEVDPAIDEIAWYRSNSQDGTQKVGRKARNPWGLYDTLGNVFEWCADVFTSYKPDPETDPFHDSAQAGSLRVMRGGGNWGDARSVRAASRVADVPGVRFLRFGFRLARGQDLRKQDTQA